MALSGVLQHNFAGYFRLQVEWSATQNQSANTSTVTANLYLISLNSASTISAPAARQARIFLDGTTYASSSVAHKISISGNQKKLLHTATKTISHNSDGTKSFDIGANIDWGLTINGQSGATVTMPTVSQTLNKLNGIVSQGPSVPMVLYPTTRISASGWLTFQWRGGIDPLGRAVSYRIAYKGGQGGSWNYTSWFSNVAEVKTYNINLNLLANGPQAMIAVQARNSDGYESSFAYSAEFTIANAVAPSVPTQTAPPTGVVQIRTQGIRLQWHHNGQGSQIAYRLKWKLKSASSWSGNTWTTSSQQFHDFPANTLAVGEYEWQVETRDANGLDSPASTSRTLLVGNPTTAPNITAPSISSTISSPNFFVAWTVTGVQQAYELQVLNDTTGLIVFNTGTVSSTVQSHYVEAPLVDGQTYRVRVRVQVGGVWSSYTTRYHPVSFTPPPMPTLDFIGTDLLPVPAIGLAWTTPTPSTNLLPDFTSGMWQNKSTTNPITPGEAYSENTYLQIQMNLTGNADYTFSADFLNSGGGRLQYTLYDATNTELATNSLFSDAMGPRSITFYAPPSTAYVVLRLFTSWPPLHVNETALHYGMNVLPWEVGPAGSVPPVAYRYIERRPYGTEAWVKIANQLPPGVGGYIDYTPGASTLYEYRVVAVGANDTISVSNIVEAYFEFEHAYLQDSEDYFTNVIIDTSDTREEEIEVPSELMFFNGRKRPIREYSQFELRTMTLDFYVDTLDQLDNLRELVRRRKTCLYRDNTGRRMFVTLDRISVTDDILDGFEVSIPITETDYKEGY